MIKQKAAEHRAGVRDGKGITGPVAATREGVDPAGRLAPEQPRAVAESVADVAELGRRERQGIGRSERIVHRITLFGGSMPFVWLNAAWFSVWIIINIPGIGWRPFDPFPFTLLTMIVSLEAIFLSIFVLITQNQQSIESDRRTKVDLQVNMIAEREITEVLQLLKSIHEHIGVDISHDHELREMLETTQIGELADQTDAAEVEDKP